MNFKSFSSLKRWPNDVSAGSLIEKEFNLKIQTSFISKYVKGSPCSSSIRDIIVAHRCMPTLKANANMIGSVYEWIQASCACEKTFFVSHLWNYQRHIKQIMLWKPPTQNWNSKQTKKEIPGLMVMGRDSHSEGCGFESQHCILDGHFFAYKCCKNCNDVCLNRLKINKKEAGDGPFKKKQRKKYALRSTRQNVQPVI